MNQTECEFSMQIEGVFHFSRGVCVVAGKPGVEGAMARGGIGEIIVDGALRCKGEVGAEEWPSPHPMDGSRFVSLVDQVRLTSDDVQNHRCEFRYSRDPRSTHRIVPACCTPELFK